MRGIVCVWSVCEGYSVCVCGVCVRGIVCVWSVCGGIVCVWSVCEGYSVCVCGVCGGIVCVCVECV